MASSSSFTLVPTETHQTSEFPESQVPENFVNFGIGQPSPRLLHLEQFRNAFTKKFCEGNPDPLMLQYGVQSGHRGFRGSLAPFLSRQYGFTVEAEDLLATNGNSHATQLCIQRLVGKGELLLMDDPTYHRVGDIVKACGAQIKLVPSHVKTGLDVDHLEKLLRNLNLPVKALYCVPFHQNPTGACSTEENARKLAQLSSEFGFYVLADEPYPLLNHVDAKRKITSLRKYEVSSAASRIISMGTFSKIVAPGLRCGWLHAPRDILQKYFWSDPVLMSGGCFNPVVACTMQELIESGELDVILRKLNAEFSERARVLFEAFTGKEIDGSESVGSVPGLLEFERPSGGYFGWLRLTDGTDTGKWREFCLDEKSGNEQKYMVGFLHGDRCKVDLEGLDTKRFSSYFRVSWAFYEAAELREGVRRLFASWRDFKQRGA